MDDGPQPSSMVHRPSSDADALSLLADAHRQISDLLREMPPVAAPELGRLGLVGALRRVVDQELGSAFDGVTWEVAPEAERKAQEMPSLPAEVVFYAAREAIRNAARYGRDDASRRPLRLRVAVAWHGGLDVLVEDDGVGLGAHAHHAGRENGSNGGSGQGLALHSTMMAVVGGSLATESMPGKYTRVALKLPEGSW